MKLLASCSLLLILVEGKSGGSTGSCPSSAPPAVSLVSSTCGSSSDTSGRQTWLGRFWTGFLGLVTGNGNGLGRQDDPLILGGSQATINEAPFMAFLDVEVGSSSSTFVSNCSGMIVSDQFVVTSAWCIYPGRLANASKVTVWVGSATIRTGTPIVADYWKTHPDYTGVGTVANVTGNHVGLIHLPNRLTFDSTIQPICYPMSDVLGTAVSGCNKKAYGWGGVDVTGVTKGSTTLKKFSDFTITSDNCAPSSDNRHFCVKANSLNTGVCGFGDSGGPLVLRYGGRAFLTGILSYVTQNYCGSDGYAVYIRASVGATWVNSIVNA